GADQLQLRPDPAELRELQRGTRGCGQDLRPAAERSRRWRLVRVLRHHRRGRQERPGRRGGSGAPHDRAGGGPVGTAPAGPASRPESRSRKESVMKIPSIPTILAAIACVSGSVAISHAAQTIASPAIFGASTQQLAQCTIGNTGTKTVDVTVTIVDEAGNVLPAASTCNEPLLGNFECSVFANAIPSGGA